MSETITRRCDACGEILTKGDFMGMNFHATAFVTKDDRTLSIGAEETLSGYRGFHCCVKVKCAEKAAQQLREQMERDIDSILAKARVT